MQGIPSGGAAKAQLRRQDAKQLTEPDCRRSDAKVPTENAFDPWAVPEPEPTTLIALWPHPQPPFPSEVLAAGGRSSPRTAKDIEEVPGEAEVIWSRAVKIPDHGQPAVIWSEPARPLDPKELDDSGARQCRWIVGAETVLDQEDPLGDFARMIRWLAGSVTDLPALLDANSGRWHPRDALHRGLLADDLPPMPEALWIVHAVGNADGATWLHTHGLARCGRPELEMIGVPSRYATTACELLCAIAGRLLEEPAPPPGEPFEIGRDLAVTFRRWQEVVPLIGAGVPGGMADRGPEDHTAHRGVRAVVGPASAEGAGRDIRLWPKDALEAVAEGGTPLYLSRQATEHAAAQARVTWPRLQEAFESLAGGAGEPPARFLIKAGHALPGEPEAPREHIWFEVKRFEGDRARGALLDTPVVIGSMKRGESGWIDRETVSDWSVRTPLGVFGPAEAEAMSRAIRSLP